MQNFKMEVSRRENGKTSPIGNVEFQIPVLADFGISVEATGTDKDGVPTYSDEKHQMLMASVVAYCKGHVRNCLKPQSLECRDGGKLPETLQDYLEAGEGRGLAMVKISEFCKFVETWVKAKGMPDGVQKLVMGTIGNRNLATLKAASPANRKLLHDKIFSPLVADMATESIDGDEETTLAEYHRSHLQKIEDALTAEEAAIDFNLLA